MQLIIKSQHIDIPNDLRDYIEGKIGNVVRDLKDPTVCEIMLVDANGPKGGEDKEIRVTCSVPHIKNPVHVVIATTDFYKSVDLIEGKLQRALHNAKR